MSKSYKSPICSCIACREVKSAKGIHSHFLAVHTVEGKEKLKNASKLGASNGAKATSSKYKKVKEQLELDYSKNPNLCNYCESILSFTKRNNKFCSSSCSAKSGNKTRIENGYDHSKCSEKISKTLKNNSQSYTKIKFKICRECDMSFIWAKGRSKSLVWCSKECAYIGRSKIARNNPGLGTKRSKHEIELFELCKSSFSNVTHNEALFNGWDADILLHDYKIAILWNGPWHYREMNIGNHSLKQVQNRDAIKIKEILKRGWIPLVFEDRYYTPESALVVITGESTRVRTETMPC